MPEDHPWNLKNCIGLLKDHPEDLEGVKTPYQYYGPPGTFFCWHREDCGCYSVNIHLGGKIKVWYVVAPEHYPALDFLFNVSIHMQLFFCLRYETFCLV